MNNGSPVSGVVTSADASGGVSFTIYRMGGPTTETIAGTRRIVITDIILSTVAGELATIAANAAVAHSAGNLIAKITTETGALTFSHHFSTGFECPPGKTPELICSAGQVDCVITGYLMDA